jgi:hypothetical protein
VGPAGVDRDGVGFGESVYSYGNSSLRLGISARSRKQGISLGTNGGGWSHPVYTATPASPVTPAARSCPTAVRRWACSGRWRARRSPAATV